VSDSVGEGDEARAEPASAGLIARLKRVENPALRTFLLYARGTGHWLAHGHVLRRREVQRYLEGTAAPRLHVGGGPIHLEGWLNADLISGDAYLDLTRRLPLPDARFDFVYSEHTIEHIPDSAVDRLLREIHRVLRPGGVVRLTTPDLKKLIAIYEDRNPVVSRDDYARHMTSITGKAHDRACQSFNDALRLWGHRYIFDEEDLGARLRGAGFEQVRRCENRDSDHDALRDLERHGGADWMNQAEAMTLEATRSARRS